MICPRCGQPQLPGSRRCPNCGSRVYSPGAVAYSRAGTGGRVLLVWGGLLIVGLLLLHALPGVLAPRLSRAGHRVESLVKPAPSPTPDRRVAAPLVLITPTAARATPTPAVTSGPHVIVTEQQLNEAIAEHAEDIRPADHAVVQITDSGLVVQFGAYGMSGIYRGRVTVVDGVPVVSGGKIDGALGWFVSPSQLESTLNDEIGAAVLQQGVTVQRVDAQPGQLIFYLRS